MKFVVAITGASGSVYAQRLIDCLAESGHVADVVLSNHAHEVIAEEIGELRVPAHFPRHRDRSMQVPFASGSALYDAMVVIPCSMGTLARIAYGYSDSVITRAADVFLKERRKLVLVPRETPWNLVHARNVVALIESGATMIPAMPSFYGRPQTVGQLVDTVVARVLDHIGVGHDLVQRWKS
ncbi:MAG: UbiX family flavin prenyltransferase [Verrucomicrobiae bacterium]|nr:UbiX family flavin prenyltransferase [Verrucomicrobiae bacterium]